MVSVSSSPADYQELLPSLGFPASHEFSEEKFNRDSHGIALSMLSGTEGFSPGSSRHSLLLLEGDDEPEEEARKSVSLFSCVLSQSPPILTNLLTPTSPIRTAGTPTADLLTSTTDEPEIIIDEYCCNVRPPVVRRHSTCEITESVIPLPSLHQRRSSMVTLPSLTTLAPPPAEESRKLSDPAVRLRNERVRNTYVPRQKRCLSDSEAPNFSTEDDDCKSEDYGSSALDSGYHDSRFHDPAASSRVSLDNFSEDYSFIEPLASPNKMRRPTPFSPFGPKPDGPNQVSWPIEEPHSAPVVVHKRSLPSRQSQSSIATSSESVSMSSFLESQMSQVSAVDFLSSLGFDDYDSPQLIPDRFIPKDAEHVMPSVMKTQSFDDDESYCPSRAPSISTMSESSVSSTTMHRPPPLLLGTHDLPLGATAETLSLSPPPETEKKSVIDKLPPSNTTQTQTFYRYNTVLETVPEETASDLSPSPRWLSPRVSIDHSIHDFSEGKLGGNLKIRKRSLPTREGYRLSIGSQVESETGDSIHVSVTSYDDEMALEKEREREELAAPIPVEDSTQPYRRARKKGVYVPPASVLTWLNSQETISEEQQNPEELPWPFNEQAKLRVSLTEIQLERGEPRLLEDPRRPAILDQSRSPSPYGHLSVCSSQRTPSPVQQTDNLAPPKRRSRSLSPIVPPKIEPPARLLTTDDIHLRPSAACTWRITEDSVTVWPDSELNSQGSFAIETNLSATSDVELRTDKLLSRQHAIFEDNLDI